MNAVEMGETIETSLDDYFERRATRTAASAVVRASEVGHPCARYLYYGIARWQERGIRPGLQRIFDVGHVWHSQVERWLREAGIHLQRMNEPFQIMEQGLVLIQGHVDGMLPYGSDDPARTEYMPIEVKSFHPGIFDRVNRLTDFYARPWMRKYPGQLLTYCYAHSAPEGLFLLVNKSNGQTKTISVSLTDHLDEAQACIDRAWAVRRCLLTLEQAGFRADETIEAAAPDRLVDVEVCRGCDFQSVCLPPMVNDPRVIIASDAQADQDMDRRTELVPWRAEYQLLDAKLKAWAKAHLGADEQVKFITTGRHFVTVRRIASGSRRVTFERLKRTEENDGDADDKTPEAGSVAGGPDLPAGGGRAADRPLDAVAETQGGAHQDAGGDQPDQQGRGRAIPAG